MVFSSPLFLFLFLPIVLVLHFFIKVEYRNFLLLVVSLLFYSWGEPQFVVLMIISVIMNYFYGLLVAKYRDTTGKLVMFFAIVTNIGLLVFFKYINFIVDNFNIIFNSEVYLDPIALPLGISFYTFHSLSYVIDIYRRKSEPQRNLFDLALYISFFPQLVAGPIVRYHDIAKQLKTRLISLKNVNQGFQRFIYGLGKKVLIANPLGSVADQIFSQNTQDLTSGAAWLGIICYTLQIYFDFSGYSDMAIGLAKMFGFSFLENFNYPYIAKNIRGFWRRWHMSLSNWFRDYLYIPLGGSRVSNFRVYLNLLIVFFCTGLWHGASWNFIFWGLFHGFFMLLERSPLGKLMDRMWAPFQHAYTLLVVMVGWIFFRANDFQYAIAYLKTMIGFNGDVGIYNIGYYLDNELIFVVILAFIGATPLLKILLNHYQSILDMGNSKYQITKLLFIVITEIVVLLLVSAALASQTYNPFIYFRF
ncbi:MBOAT family O-acyltransferase [Paenibacillus sp. FSL P2-0089]|uniref:MBOAT family O-acyltransferase n=1 Tax=unclassified Paenibacillus TaxID=185978 RepID=UPI0030FC0276